MLLQLLDSGFEELVVELAVGGVEVEAVLEKGGVQAAQPDGEGLGQLEILAGLCPSEGDFLDLLGGKVGGLLFVEGLPVVVVLAWPGVLVGHLGAAIFADEQVLGTHVSNLVAIGVEGGGGGQEGEDEVPQLVVVESLGVEAGAVADLVGQQEGVVLEGELHSGGGTSTRPALPQ